MGSVNIKGSVTSLVPSGTPSPLRLASPQQIRSLATGLPNGVASSLAKDLDDVNRVVNQLHTNQQISPVIKELLLTNAAGQVTAAFGPVTFQGVPYTNYLSEIHVGNPMNSRNPQQALFNANLDGSVSIGQNGWIDVHDPFEGNAAWIGTQYDNLVITNAVNNGAGEIRITTQTPHTFTVPNNVTAVVRNLNLWNIPNGDGKWTLNIINATTLDLIGSIWSGPYVYIDNDDDVDVVTDLPTGLPTYQATIQRVLLIASITKPATLIEVETTIPHTYETGDQVNIPLPVTATVVSQWIITVVDPTHFTLDDSTTPVVADFAGATTCLRYFAGMLAQNFAIGNPDFPNYKLRAFPNGDLRIRDAIIQLSSAGGGIVIDPSVPDIILTSASDGKITLDGANAQITLNAPLPSLAKIVMDAAVPSITLFNAAGTQTIKLDSNGVITGATFTGGFSGVAALAKLSGPGSDGSLTFVNGFATAYSAPT